MARGGKRKWSQAVTEHSDALDLEPHAFADLDSQRLAESLRRSAEASPRRKTSAFRSAMSMLTFYINRAGRTLPDDRRRALEDAKRRLRKLFGRPEAPRAGAAEKD